MQLDELKKGSFVVGTKQVLRAIEQGKAKAVCIASDCEERVKKPLVSACQMAGIVTDDTHTRAELGRACKLQVGAAALAVLESHR